MFDRHKSSRAGGPLCVEIALEGGRDLKGKFAVPADRALTEVLNGPSSFIEFEPFGGERMFIAKSALRSVKELNMPAAPQLGAGSRTGGSFDPYAILGVSAGASAEDIRQAYLAQAKIYHPDRYATAELPAEVRAYLADMARRINAAYDTLETARRKKPVPEPASPEADRS
ncbi:MAG: J domain-containing protein [Hyphomicrobiaceae bacterium]|nr:MAG: J domain-containing protein [Hyphomicrobiaceae bacterium]